MNEFMLFIDGSVNAQSHIGFGAYLLYINAQSCTIEDLKTRVKVKRFENTSSTKLELQTLMWALTDIQIKSRKIIIYTDSQNIINLPERQNRLEVNDYYSKQGKRFKHYELYKEFYQITDQLDYELIKVQGHLRSRNKNEVDQVFTLVDRAARKALRDEIRH